MSYRWQLELSTASATTQAELALAGADRDFDSQEQAEQWMSGFYADLIDLDVAAVTLLEADRVVYGPMSLLAG